MFGTRYLDDEHDCNVISMNSLDIYDANDMQSHKFGGSSAKKPNPFPRAQVNHLDVEDVYDQPDTLVGKFLLNSRPVLVLFDSGATHSFISRVVVEKYGLPTRTLRTPLQVSFAGGEMMHA